MFLEETHRANTQTGIEKNILNGKKERRKNRWKRRRVEKRREVEWNGMES